MPEYVYIEEIRGISEEEISNLIDQLREEEHDSYLDCLDDITRNGWYCARGDLIEWSGRHPDRLIEVRMSDEENNFWTDFIKNGSWYREKAQVIFPDFDPEKLEEGPPPCE